jgi:hypothetical protein
MPTARAALRALRGLLAPAGEFVGLAGHGGDHDRNVMAFAPLARDVSCNIANALYVCTDVPPNFITRRAIVSKSLPGRDSQLGNQRPGNRMARA